MKVKSWLYVNNTYSYVGNMESIMLPFNYILENNNIIIET